MLSSLFFLTLGSLGLYFGSEWLIDGAKALAKKFKVSDLVIGLTIVSIGTSFPELVVGLISAFQGYTDFVVGNVLGSNIANIGLAIGLPAFFYKIDFNLKGATAPFVYNLLACVMLYIFLQDNLISFVEAQALLLVFFVYIIASFLRPNITSCDGELENEEELCIKKAVGRIKFECTQFNDVRRVFNSLSQDNQTEKIILNSIGIDEQGDVVSEFSFEWSLKLKF